MSEPSKAVFLSYASQDAEAAKRICEALRAAGIEVWFDQSELRGGDAWDHHIRRQIADCALFVPIISTHTQARSEGYFRLEWDLADQRGHMIARSKAFIIPICVDDTPDRGAEVPESFLKVQWTRLPEGATPTTFVERVSRLLSPEPARAPAEIRSPAAAAPHTAAAPRRSAPSAAASRQTLRVLLLIAAAAVIGVGYLAVDKFILLKRPAPSTVSAPAVQSLAPAPSAIPEKSIAVLPFVDMSEKHDQEYFSDGLAEELLDLLAKTPGLHVIARTSSFSFKSKSDDIPTIAKKLNVANILEGSVRRSGNRLRVTTQLIRASNGEQLWSETYDREMKDVFKVQDEIAGAVVSALKLKLTPSQDVSGHRTANTDAYNLYLLGRQLFNRRTADAYRRATDAYHKAIALDPDYAAAYAGLAIAECYVADSTGDMADYRAAQAAADKAVALAPEQADGYLARGYLRYTFSFDYVGAQADLAKALALDPDDNTVQLRYGELMSSLGRLPEAIAATKKAIELDPLSESAWQILAQYQYSSGDFAAAHEANRHALEINPESAYALTDLGIMYLLEGKATEALATFRKVGRDEFRLFGTAMAEHTLGHATESRNALDELIAKHTQTSAYQIAEVCAWRGEKDKAFEWLERAYAQQDGGLSIVKSDPLLDSLRSDSRYRALLRKLKLPE